MLISKVLYPIVIVIIIAFFLILVIYYYVTNYVEPGQSQIADIFSDLLNL